MSNTKINNTDEIKKINATYVISIETDVDFVKIKHKNLKYGTYKTMTYKEYLKQQK